MAELEMLDSYLPLVAIVGRPNVGKSTLFNRIVRRRKATVLDTPGVTRDRNFERGEWNGRPFMLVDTGGYETEPRDATFDQMREQALLAIDEAEVVIFMTDVLEDEHPVDSDVANILRRSKKPVILAVNKCDNPKRSQEAVSFYALGFEEVVPIGALAGFGVADMLDRITDLLPDQGEHDLSDLTHGGLRIAVVGRPNVGKSSLVNAILQRDRVIVNPMPGTTRDTIDTTFRWRPDARKGDTEPPEERVYTLIDTAGLRRRGKIEKGVEKLSTLSAQASLRRCDVAVVMIDAADGLTEQDQRIAGYAHEAFRPTIIVVNKWDLVEKDTHTAGKFVRDLYDEMGFLTYAPVVMTSALTGQRVHKVLSLAEEINAASRKEVSTSALNEWLADTVKRLSPPWHKGKQLRIKYVTQTGIHPPTFTFFVNNPRVIHFSYERYLVNRLRESFGFKGTPIRLDLRRKGRSKEEWR